MCCHYGVCGQAYYLYKPVGKGKTFGLKPELALQRLKDGLRDPSIAFVYHCLNHYFCPIGYEDVPKMAPDAYKYVHYWILNSDGNVFVAGQYSLMIILYKPFNFYLNCRYHNRCDGSTTNECVLTYKAST